MLSQFREWIHCGRAMMNFVKGPKYGHIMEHGMAHIISDFEGQKSAERKKQIDSHACFQVGGAKS
jgi:hypothetical protein